MGLASIVLALSLSAQPAQPPHVPPQKAEVRITHYAIVRDEQYEAEQRMARHMPDDDGFGPLDGYRKTSYSRRLGRS